VQILKKERQIANSVISASRKHFSGHARTHIHEFFEIEYIISGSGTCLVDGRAYPMEPGALFLLTPANTHTVRDADAEMINVMFQCGYGFPDPALPMLCAPPSSLFLLEEADRPLMLSLLTELLRVHTDNISYAHTLLACAMQKLAYYPHAEERKPLPYIQRAFLYITEHFRSGITLEDTAAHLGLSSTYFSELFVQQTGMNFKAYLDSIRFSHAQNLLSFTDIPVCTVHAYAGFGDYANFSRRFKRLVGITPSAYRKRSKNRQTV